MIMRKERPVFPALGKVRELYEGAGKARVIEKISGGYLRHNFVLGNGRHKFFLRQYRFDDAGKIEKIHKVKFFFARGGISVILPIKNKTGDFLFRSEKKYYALFPYATGRVVKAGERTKKMFVSAGAMLARMHLLGAKGDSLIAGNLSKAWNAKAFLESGQKNIREGGKMNLRNDHVVHGDYCWENIFYDENGSIKAVFDFEETEIAPREFDLARSMHAMCFSDRFEKENFGNAKVFLKAYSKLYPLPEEGLLRGIKAYYLKEALKADALSAGVLRICRKLI